MHRVGGWFRAHRPAVAGVLMGATAIPGLIGVAVAQPTARPINVPADSNPFTAASTPEAKLALLKDMAADLESKAGTMTPAELTAAREKLLADYTSGGGTLGLTTDEDSDGTSTAKEILFGTSDKTINSGNVTEFALFKHFWTSDEMGLARRGLDEVTPEGVDKLVKFAMDHELDGTKSKESSRRIDADERAVVKAMLEHDHHGAFFEMDARPLMFKRFGLDPGTVHMPPGAVHPTKVGDISIPSVSTRSDLRSIDRDGLAQAFADEYASRKAYFESPSLSQEEKGLRTVGLLKDYADALWSRGERNDTEAIGHDLLTEFEKLPFSKTVGSKDFNGAGWSVAQSLVLGLDPNVFETRFPKAGPTTETTYLSMDGAMADAMKFVDQWREAKGLPKAAEEFELKSPLGWMLGVESGHKKRGNLDEMKPFSSSGLNWGVLLFPGDAQVKNLPVKEGFEFPMDIIDGFGNAVVAKAAYGDKIVVRDQATNKTLTVEKVIHKDASGKDVSWSAVFKDQDGNTVDPSKAIGLVTNSYGTPKGDGKATKSLNMWWWGFCDRNTAGKLYKSKYEIPQIDRDSIKVVVNGKTITVPKAEAQKLIDMDVPDLVPYETMSGFRFDEEPQYIKLKDGTVHTARVKDIALEAGPGTTRLTGDMLAIHDAPGRPMLGTLEIKDSSGSTKGFDVRYIDSLTKDASGQVTIKMKDDFPGWPKSATGELTTSVPWEKATTVDGKQVLKQDAEMSIRGGFTLEMGDGSTIRVDAKDVSQIVGEMQKDMRISQFSVWVSQNKGMFATDGSTGVVVSNGMRWVNKIDTIEQQGDERPSWAPKGELTGIEGPMVRQPGDKILWVKAQYAYNKDAEPNSSAYEGWIQVSKTGRILNEAFTSGQPDFGWSANGNLDWGAKSSFSPYMDPEMRLRIFVNGVTDEAKLQKMADEGNLPSNWKSLRTPQ